MNDLNREVHVWTTRFDPSTIDCQHVLDLASTSDLARSVSFPPDQRLQFLALRTALRTVLSRYLPGISPKDIAIGVGVNNKPYIAQVPSLRFSYSDSGDVAAVAVTAKHEVGLDVQFIHPVHGWRGIALRLFGTEFATALAQMDAQSRWEAFAQHWVRMEAVSKVGGEGLTQPRAAKLEWRLRTHYVRDFVPCDGWVGALASPVAPLRFRHFDLADCRLGRGELARATDRVMA